MGILSFLFSRAEPQNPAPQMQIRRYYNKYDIIPTDYTVIDTETSGLSPSTFEILEIAAIKVRNHVEVSRYHTYIRPEGAISADASKVNGLTWPKLRNKPFLKDVKQKFLDFIGDDVLVGHNIGFDIRFIQTRCEIDLQNKCFDTLRWSRLVFPHISDHKLDTLRRALALGGEAHSALGDCVATHQLLQHIANSGNNFDEINNRYKANRVSCIQSLVVDYDNNDDDDNFEVGFGYWSEGEAARLQGDFNKALELFNRAESEGYSCPAIFTSYAMVYRKQKDYENELAIIEKALKVFDGKASFTTATKNFLNRKERVEQLILAQKKREELIQEKQAIREAKAEERRKKAEMAASEPKRPRTRSIAQCLDDGTIIKEYESITAAARELGSSTKNIRDAANGKQHHACGFCWKYTDVNAETNSNIYSTLNLMEEREKMQQEREYRQFTKPAELHKAINTLRGIVAGINTDAKVSKDEINELTHWCQVHAHLSDRHPFSEIIPVVEAACADGVVTEDEAKDILWVCSSFADSGAYYDAITSSIQFLAGLVHGIMADGEISDSEITALQSWINANEFLAGCYPYDEINSLLSTILEDKKIDDDERKTLLAFLSNLVEFKDSFNLSEKDFSDLKNTYSVPGICASCPDVQIEGRTFCFTGESYRATRKEINDVILRLGGTLKGSVSKKTDYLVVGNAGNPCWAYACYGRKIEEAMQLRKAGAKVVIINETDFWDIVEDALAGIE